MVKDKNEVIMRSGDYVLYKGKVWKLERQMSGHINLRNTKGDLVSVAGHDVEFHNGPTSKEIAAVEATKTAKSSVTVESTIIEASAIDVDISKVEVKKKRSSIRKGVRRGKSRTTRKR